MMQEWHKHLADVVRWLEDFGLEVHSVNPSEGFITVRVRNPDGE